eukprot:scaffold1146_cov399-Prasinococcus_capsulatus_cf.AAC.29
MAVISVSRTCVTNFVRKRTSSAASELSLAYPSASSVVDETAAVLGGDLPSFDLRSAPRVSPLMGLLGLSPPLWFTGTLLSVIRLGELVRIDLGASSTGLLIWGEFARKTASASRSTSASQSSGRSSAGSTPSDRRPAGHRRDSMTALMCWCIAWAPHLCASTSSTPRRDWRGARRRTGDDAVRRRARLSRRATSLESPPRSPAARGAPQVGC